jgi:hypothetical protein
MIRFRYQLVDIFSEILEFIVYIISFIENSLEVGYSYYKVILSLKEGVIIKVDRVVSYSYPYYYYRGPIKRGK